VLADELELLEDEDDEGVEEDEEGVEGGAATGGGAGAGVAPANAPAGSASSTRTPSRPTSPLFGLPPIGSVVDTEPPGVEPQFGVSRDRAGPE